ncbi:MAG TPA: septal ring lytic transglycosylase RlpA family protein [Bacteroidia bacterium]
MNTLLYLMFATLPVTPNQESLQTYYGKATWYGEVLQGNYTASGEIFDCNKFTAAHKFLPLGTIARVTNLRNNKSVIVKINDRLPVTSSPFIDLSKATARELEFLKMGRTDIRLDVLETPEVRKQRLTMLLPEELRSKATKRKS